MPGMTLLIGIDEAGYGPNLGPLCIGASAWNVDGGGRKGEDLDLYQRLAEVISSAPDKHRIAVADSKRLYKPASHAQHNGLIHLERAVLTALEMLQRPAADMQALLALPELPWYADYNCALPVDVDVVEVMALVDQWQIANEAADVQLLDLQVRMVFPEEFNSLVTEYGTKGAALSHVSIELARELLDRNSQLATHTSVMCDKHGGRNRYAALLQHHFPEHLLQVVEESRPLSRYRWGAADCQTEVSFRSKGEAELPVALASMAAKYFRELAMRAFNAFWTSKVPELKPTAGYPQDAKRFKAEIEAVQSKLGIEDRILWRTR